MTLRVCHIITQLELGGAQRNTLYTVGHLDPARFETYLLSGMGGILDRETARLKTRFISTLQRAVHPVLDILALGQLYGELRRLRPHIVHTHSSKAGILGRLAAYVAGVPVIIHTFHGFGFTPTQRPAVRRLYVTLERWCAYLTQHLVFVSEDNRQEAEREGIHGRATTSVIRSGIDVAPVVPESAEVRAELGLPEDAWVVVSVGNFKAQKNPLDLAAVACGVVSADPSIHVLWVGDGELRPQAEEKVRAAGHGERVHFLGWRPDVANLLAASNAFVLTSLWEGLPRALVEAFAARLPAVAYAVNGVKDILIDGENGFAIEPGDTTRAIDRLLWLKAHPEEAARFAAAGRRRIEEEFDIDRMVRAQETLYDDCWQRVPLKEYYAPTWAPTSTNSNPDSI